MPVELPEPFRSAVAEGRAQEVCDADAAGAAALYGRGLARAQTGRDRDARDDFEQALDELGDPCLVQLGLLDLRRTGAPEEVASLAREIAARSEQQSVIRAQALHLNGLAETRLRDTARAVDALVEAGEILRTLGRNELLARVEDSLGMVWAARGRLDLALSHYALSLVLKTLAGDRYGTAITLGNLGRVHLRAGRPRDAMSCLHLDLEICQEMGDTRGQARICNDLGRALVDLEETAEAEAMLRRSLELALEHGYPDLEFFSRKDLALMRVGEGRLDEARAELEALQGLVEDGAAAHLQGLLLAVRGRFMLADGDDGGLEVLEQAAAVFRQHELPDLEIPVLTDLAEDLARRGLVQSAETFLRRGLQVARQDGYARYLPDIREAMARLQLVESAVEESGRLATVAGEEPTADGYILFESLGKGGFGEVFRAFDPQRSRYVALKRLDLERLYDVERREQLLTTARIELEAASRIRHPGIAQVWAIGTDSAGGSYVVQDFIQGRPLRKAMADGGPATVSQVLRQVGRVASALQALHAKNVIHRDLKPENIILRASDDTPVLIDFGIAWVPDSEARLVPGTIVGTVGYMAPEQLLGYRVDGKADVFALGVLTFEWLTGQRPVEPSQGSLRSTIETLARAKAPPVASKRADLPPVVTELIDRMLDRSPDLRPSAATVAETCERILALEDIEALAASAAADAAAETMDLPPTVPVSDPDGGEG